jgi:hypothetical protein
MERSKSDILFPSTDNNRNSKLFFHKNMVELHTHGSLRATTTSGRLTSCTRLCKVCSAAVQRFEDLIRKEYNKSKKK